VTGSDRAILRSNERRDNLASTLRRFYAGNGRSSEQVRISLRGSWVQLANRWNAATPPSARLTCALRKQGSFPAGLVLEDSLLGGDGGRPQEIS
jgi:hypothetical protein